MNNTGRMGIGVISAGKVGCALASALRAAGHSIVGAYAHSDESRDRLEAMLPGVPALEIEPIVERSEVVILALPDTEIEPLVSGLAKLHAWQAGQIVFHTAGPYGSEILKPAVLQGALGLAIHPAMSFSGTSLDVARLTGAKFAISSPVAIQPIGLALAAEMGGEGIVVKDSDRPLYYSALIHGANHMTAVITQSQRLLMEAGIPEAGEYLRPLLQTALDAAISSGESQLGGPLEVGHGDIVSDQMALIGRNNPSLADISVSALSLANAMSKRLDARRLSSNNGADHQGQNDDSAWDA